MPQDPKKRKAQKVLDNLGDTNLAHLEATLELGDKLDELKTAIENIPETIIPEYPTFPAFPEIPETITLDTTKIESLLNNMLEESKKPCQITLTLDLK